MNMPNDGIKHLRTLLNDHEKKVHQIDFGDVTLGEYMKRAILGTRRYALKDTDDTIPRAKVIMKL